MSLTQCGHSSKKGNRIFPFGQKATKMGPRCKLSREESFVPKPLGLILTCDFTWDRRQQGDSVSALDSSPPPN